MHALVRDERGVVTGWFVRVILSLAIAGVVLFDAAALVINYFGLDSAADEMAVAISTDVDSLPNRANFKCDVRNVSAAAPRFCQEAHNLANESNATLLEASLDQESIVRVRLRRTADTVLVKRLGFLKKYGVARAQGQSGSG
jgi:hypothetical protein